MGIFWFVLPAAALASVGLFIWRGRRGKKMRRTWRERFDGLQWRMTFSYVWITIASVLVFTLLVSPARILLVPVALALGLFAWLRSRHNRRKAAQHNARARSDSWRWGATLPSPWITSIVAVTLFFLLNLASYWLSGSGPVSKSVTLVQQTAQQYASAVAQQAQGQALGDIFPYPLGQPLDVTPNININVNTGNLISSDANTSAAALLRTEQVPYLPKLYPANQPVIFALLIAPDQRILSSSYPLRYPIGGESSTLLPEQNPWIAQALRGNATAGTFTNAQGTMVYATASVLDKHAQAVGTLYVQAPLAIIQATEPKWFTSFQIQLLIALILLIVLAPLGGIFGFFSTRGLVKRLKRLATATTLVANGDYQQRLPVASRDEIGQLEQQFNRMAEQLGESTTRQKVLTEENARLAERARISRELHDAISQDLFSLSLLAGGLQSALPDASPLQHQASMLGETTNNTIREMRALLLELRPTALEQLSLVDALKELASAYRTRLGICVKTELTTVRLETRYEHTLLRVAQEALANAARHAGAMEITITLALDEQSVTLSVRDNGRGLHADAESLRHGLGLRMMRERVEELQGTLLLAGAPGQGTTITVSLPLEKQL